MNTPHYGPLLLSRFAELYVHLDAMVRHRFRGASDWDVDAVLAECRLRLHKKAGKFDPSKNKAATFEGKLASFVKAMLRLCIREAIASRGRDWSRFVSIEAMNGEAWLSDELEPGYRDLQDECLERLQKALLGLPEKDRRILREHWFKERSLEAIGSEYDMSSQACRQAHHQALNKLRARYKALKLQETRSGLDALAAANRELSDDDRFYAEADPQPGDDAFKKDCARAHVYRMAIVELHELRRTRGGKALITAAAKFLKESAARMAASDPTELANRKRKGRAAVIVDLLDELRIWRPFISWQVAALTLPESEIACALAALAEPYRTIAAKMWQGKATFEQACAGIYATRKTLRERLGEEQKKLPRAPEQGNENNSKQS